MRFFVISACLAGAVLTGCGGNKIQEKKMSSVTIPVLRLATTDTILQHEYVVDIQASKNVEIRAKVQGFIEDILVDEGQQVRKGQPLFTINSAEFQTELTRAKAVLANAMAEAKAAGLELDRIKTLVDKKIISKTEYELAMAKLKSAQAKVDEASSEEEIARIKLSYTHIRSPFNGVIDRIPFKRGSLVDEGALLTTISDLDKMYAYFSVSESEYLRYLRAKKQGKLTGYDDITLVLADGTRFPYHGKVETTESEIDSRTGSIAFRATFPNPDKLLKHGASGKILLETSIDNALMIPQKAVMEIQDKNFVFVVKDNNKVKMKSFVPKTRINQYVVVQSGLSADDTIVYEGIQNIRDGATIKPLYVSPRSLTSIN
jgi:membrane fusion protein (multidrug efflux system)